jgi:hypothetical protein
MREAAWTGSHLLRGPFHDSTADCIPHTNFSHSIQTSPSSIPLWYPPGFLTRLNSHMHPKVKLFHISQHGLSSFHYSLILLWRQSESIFTLSQMMPHQIRSDLNPGKSTSTTPYVLLDCLGCPFCSSSMFNYNKPIIAMPAPIASIGNAVAAAMPSESVVEAAWTVEPVL